MEILRSGNCQSSVDSDDSKEIFLSELVYRSLRLRVACSRSPDYVQSVNELALLLRKCYVRSSKLIQVSIYDDILVALSSLQKMENTCQLSAARGLIKASEAVLPRKKKLSVQREFKARLLERQRQLKKRQTNEQEDSNQSAPGVSQLPDEVLLHLFSFLDAPSLATSSTVCSLWRAVAMDESLWETHCKELQEILTLKMSRRTTVRTFEAMVSPSFRENFYKGRACAPDAVRCSNRAFCCLCKGLFWLNPWQKGFRTLSVAEGENLCRGGKAHKFLFPSPAQVLALVSRDAEQSSSSDDSEDSGDEQCGSKFIRYSVRL